MQRSAISLLLLAVPATPVAAQNVAIWSGAGGQPGPIRVHAEFTPGPAVLLPGFASAELLPIDFAGRMPLLRFMPDRPRLEVEHPGVTKLVLPADKGSLFHYRRDAGTEVRFGYLLVPPDGMPRTVYEAAAGAGAGVDPFLERVAVSPDGNRLLLGTRLANGGDLIEVNVTSATSELRTASLAPLDIEPESLGFAGTFGTAQASGSALRFALAPGAQAQTLAFPPGFGNFDGGVVFSGDRQIAATIASNGGQVRHVLSWSASGPITQSDPFPTNLTGVGSAHTSAFGPHLALSHDGSLCVARGSLPLSNEAFLARIGVSGLPVEVLTEDALFDDTLDEVGLIQFVPGTSTLMFAVGERDQQEPGTIDSLDFYRAEYSGLGAPTISNITQSSGDNSIPFSGQSQINPEDGVFTIPGTNSIFLHDGKGDRLLRVGPNGSQTLASNIKELDPGLTWTGQYFVFSNIESTAIDLRQVRRLSAVGPAQVLHTIPETWELPRFVSGPGQVVASRLIHLGNEYLARLDVDSGNASFLLDSPASFDSSIGFSALGTLVNSASPSLFPGLFFGWTAAGPGIGYSSPASVGVVMTAR